VQSSLHAGHGDSGVDPAAVVSMNARLSEAVELLREGLTDVRRSLAAVETRATAADSLATLCADKLDTNVRGTEVGMGVSGYADRF
jgi:hypothetical protein